MWYVEVSSHCQMTSYVFDIYVTFFMAPVPLFPYVAGYTTGILWKILQINTHAQMVRFDR